MPRSFVIVVVFCIFIRISLVAQTFDTVTGQVVDPTRVPIARASVRLLTSGQVEIARALTDQQGHFTFREHCSPGCAIEVQLAGFRIKRVPVSSEELEIELALAPVQESLIVSATRMETPSIQIGSTTTSISAQEIAERQSLMVSDLLQTVAGAAVTRSGAPGAITSLFVRGSESDYTKVLLDGIPINEPGGYFDFSSLAADDLERIEIVRGPQSALFGSDAMAGVVQLFSRRSTAEVS